MTWGTFLHCSVSQFPYLSHGGHDGARLWVLRSSEAVRNSESSKHWGRCPRAVCHGVSVSVATWARLGRSGQDPCGLWIKHVPISAALVPTFLMDRVMSLGHTQSGSQVGKLRPPERG